MACKQAAMSWIFNGAGSFEKLPVQEDGPRTCHSERSEESQNECAEAKHIKIQDFSYLTTFHCNSIFALLLSFPKSLNFLLSPQTLPVSLFLVLFSTRFVSKLPIGYKTKQENFSVLLFLAEREGFEPPVPLSTSVFKTGAIDHSATSPKVYALRDSNPGPID